VCPSVVRLLAPNVAQPKRDAVLNEGESVMRPLLSDPGAHGHGLGGSRVPGDLGGFTGPASATTFVSCSKLTGLDTAKFTTLSAAPTPRTRRGTGKGVSKAGKGLTGTSTITWATKADGTTKVSYSYTILAASKEKCGTSVCGREEDGQPLRSSSPARSSP